VTDLGELYRRRRESIEGLVAGLTDQDAGTPVPTCPKWTVHDVVAHVVGVAVDGTSGNMTGAPGEAWTAAHVDARRDHPVGALLEEWAEVAPRLEAALAGVERSAAIVDVATHEQDIRTALSRAGERDNDAIRRAVTWLVPGFGDRVSAAGLPAVRVVTEDGEQTVGSGDPVMTLETSRFELFRAALGRRSRPQVEALFRGGDAGPYVAPFVLFGPADGDITE
jgi:uncharacterized protein (TIGR03083 family)